MVLVCKIIDPGARNLSYLRGASIRRLRVHDPRRYRCRDQILEVEEKLYLGTLGNLRVEDRQAWQAAIQTRDYVMGCEELTWGGGEAESSKLTPDMIRVSLLYSRLQTSFRVLNSETLHFTV